MNIAMVTPWPPQPTGIADYAYDLVAGLSGSGKNISVWTDCQGPVQRDGLKIYRIKKGGLPDLSTYDMVVFQMGNNTRFHLYMIDLIEKYGGIVHLHDIVLHHLMAWLTWGQGDVAGYLNLVEKWYGKTIRDLCGLLLDKQVTPWDSEIVTDLPLFQEVLQHADACIVHSDFARNKIESSLPWLPVYKIDQIYRDHQLSAKEPSGRQALKMGIFGGVDPQKHVDVCIHAFSRLLKVHGDCELHVVGKTDKRCGYLCHLTEKLGIKNRVFFYDRVKDEIFHRLLSEMDIILSLRYPTMGETSAIVMRAIQRGIPVIVNRIGWYAELPEFVDKLPPDSNMPEALFETLKSYLDPAFLARKKKAFAEYAVGHFSFRKMIASYYDILGREYRGICLRKTFKRFFNALADMDVTENNAASDHLLGTMLKKTGSIVRA